ncbi:glycosyltransferase family 4 protein [bacterium]|nr:glycosyltransferase family 4 protein [bacterium]
MAERLRILHLTASHRWTGAAEPAARQAAAETQAGHDVLYAMTTGSSFERRAREAGVEVTGAVPFERSYWPHRKLRDLRLLKELIADYKPDVVHSHLTHDHILAGVAIGPTGPGKPILVRTFHRESPPRQDAFTKSLVEKRTAGIVTISTQQEDALSQAFGLSNERMLRIGGQVDLDVFQPGERPVDMRKEWGIEPDAPVIGLISRLRRTRGIDWMLDAAEIALKQNPEARLVICGRGSYKDKMLERLEQLSVKNQIIYAGYVSGDELIGAYHAFDVALMLIPGNDGSCRSALEAMACGRPVIGGDIGAIHDLLDEGDFGWLVPTNDASALADAMVKATADPAACRARGDAARQHIEREHSPTAVARHVLDFYGRLIEARDGVAAR